MEGYTFHSGLANIAKLQTAKSRNIAKIHNPTLMRWPYYFSNNWDLCHMTTIKSGLGPQNKVSYNYMYNLIPVKSLYSNICCCIYITIQYLNNSIIALFVYILAQVMEGRRYKFAPPPSFSTC